MRMGATEGQPGGMLRARRSDTSTREPSAMEHEGKRESRAVDSGLEVEEREEALVMGTKSGTAVFMLITAGVARWLPFTGAWEKLTMSAPVPLARPGEPATRDDDSERFEVIVMMVVTAQRACADEGRESYGGFMRAGCRIQKA